MLHFLTFKARIMYKLLVLVVKVTITGRLRYLAELIQCREVIGNRRNCGPNDNRQEEPRLSRHMCVKRSCERLAPVNIVKTRRSLTMWWSSRIKEKNMFFYWCVWLKQDKFKWHMCNVIKILLLLKPIRSSYLYPIPLNLCLCQVERIYSATPPYTFLIY